MQPIFSKLPNFDAKEKTYEIALKIKNHIETFSENQSPEKIQTISVADEIRELKKLVDDGILSEDEFNIKKNQLLGF